METAVLTSFICHAHVHMYKYICCVVFLQPFVCRKTSGAYNEHVWYADLVEAGITQHVSEIVVSIERWSEQLEITSVVAKGCIGSGTNSWLSDSAIVSGMIEWFST